MNEKPTQNPPAGTPRQETVQPFQPRKEMELIRKTDEKGKRSYHTLHGGTIDTYEDDLCNFLGGLFEKMEGVINLMGDDAYNEFGYIWDPIIRYAQWQIDEIFETVSRSIGVVNIDLVTHNNWPYRAGRVVGVSLKPPKEVAHD